MRFPMHFPPNIGNADEFIEKYMPNLFKYIWSKGVRFANHADFYSVERIAADPNRTIDGRAFHPSTPSLLSFIGHSSSLLKTPAERTCIRKVQHLSNILQC